VSKTLHVLVEVRAASRGNAAQLDLPGFELDPRRAQIRVPADDSCDEDRIVMRGIVANADLDDLRHDPRVVDVYLDTRAAPYPDILRMPSDLSSNVSHSRFQ
jgi:hypothetical protein